MLYYGVMNTQGKTNLAKNLLERLPQDLLFFIHQAGELAEQRQQQLYLVGGAVRDLLLERCTLDIDLTIEGDALKIAPEFALINKADATVHPRFGTATLRWHNRRADLATARAETYARPGALPTVKAGTIGDDLARRDFTINAMAMALNPRRFGELIDPHGGQRDTGKKLIRVLHEKSFMDDATRIWRAVRYEQRLDFTIEPVTLGLIKRDINYLATISGDRIRHELEMVLKERAPGKILRRAGELGALAIINPALQADDWLDETFSAAAARCQPGQPHPFLYLALLCYRLGGAGTENTIKYLRLPGAASQVLRDTAAAKAKIKELAAPGLAPSTVYDLLQGYGLAAIEANALGAGSATAAEHFELYLNVLRHVNPALTGEDLLRLGVVPGPKVKELLQRLREARLDGKISSRKEEEGLVKGWLKA